MRKRNKNCELELLKKFGSVSVGLNQDEGFALCTVVKLVSNTRELVGMPIAAAGNGHCVPLVCLNFASAVTGCTSYLSCPLVTWIIPIKRWLKKREFKNYNSK